MIQPSVYFHVSKKLVVVTHVDDFLCVGPEENLTWLFKGLSAKFEMTRTIVGQGHAHEVKYLNRFISWNNGVFTIEGDTKHRNILMKEWGMEQCSGVNTPLTRDGMEKVSCGELLDESEASKVRRAIARINYMALDRADLSSAARIASQYMSEPRQGTEIVVKRIIRYLQSYPRMPNHISKKSDENQGFVEVMADSDWAGDTQTRRSCSGGLISVGGNLIHHWSKTQQTVALSSGEAEMNASVKAISEGIGVTELLKEIGIKDVRMTVYTDSSACKGTILRRGSGKVKHLTTKQLWVQGAVRAHEIDIQKIPREANIADMLTNGVNKREMSDAMRKMGYHSDDSLVGHFGPHV